jgi:hypothetical protein
MSSTSSGRALISVCETTTTFCVFANSFNLETYFEPSCFQQHAYYQHVVASDAENHWVKSAIV